MEVDGAKGTLSVTGDADPYEIIVRARKAGKFAQVVSIGPPPKPEDNKKAQEKKPEEKKAQPQAHHIHTPFSCPICDRFPVIPPPPSITRWEEPTPTPQCSIM